MSVTLSLKSENWIFQGKVTKDRRVRGLTPYLPDVADRERIKAEYIKKMTENTI